MIYSNGSKCIGDWLNGKRNGNGVYIYNDGDIYDGEYKDNKKHGFGKYIFADGTGHYSEYSDNKQIKQIRKLTPEEVAETKQKLKEHEKEIDVIRE